MGLFTNLEKAADARREVALRRNVYAKRIKAGLMSWGSAQRQIGIMEEIAAEYAERAAANQEADNQLWLERLQDAERQVGPISLTRAKAPSGP